MSIHYYQPTCKQAYRLSATNESSHPEDVITIDVKNTKNIS